ncbi:MAG: hypothetical protein ACNA8W_15430 [Bradymonadaceae bacterium]
MIAEFNVADVIQFIFARGEASSGDVRVEEEARAIHPAILFNLNLGWSI